MSYQVMQQYAKGPERQLMQFNQLAEANKFIKEKLAIDANMKISTVYRIYQYGDLVDEWTVDRWQKESIAEKELDNESSASQAGKQSSFRPSPLSTSPRPPGIPPSSFKDEDKNKE